MLPRVNRRSKTRNEATMATMSHASVVLMDNPESNCEVRPTPKPTETRDNVLIRRVLDGDREAFCALVKPYHRMIFASALSLLGNEADAEEVVQEAILKAYKNLSRFRGDCKFSTWLVQITINEGRMRLRKYSHSGYPA